MADFTDEYPTRVIESPQIMRRHDPIVWGQKSTRELALFESNGYLQREHALTPSTVDACMSEVERIQHDPALRTDERIVREAGSDAVRSIFDIVDLSTIVRDAVTESGAEDLAREILASEVYIHQSRLNHKPGFAGGAFYWHSDFETWHAEDGMPRPRAVSASIALTANETYNGPLMIMPGSHRCFVQCQGETPPAHHLESLVTETPRVGVPSEELITELWDIHGVDVLTGPAGSLTVFDSNVLHASGSNITPVPRANVFVVFNSVDNRLAAPYAADAPRPAYLARRDR